MKIAVFCSSSNRIDENYKNTARLLGARLAENSHTLVYGGAGGGLMDCVAEAAYENGGKIIGVNSRKIARMPARKPRQPIELLCAYSLGERKTVMKTLADAFVVLAGGFGTFDEAFDVIASGTVGEHSKPLVFLNENGFYDDLLRQISRCREEKFIPEEEIYKPLIANDLGECFELLKSFENF